MRGLRRAGTPKRSRCRITASKNPHAAGVRCSKVGAPASNARSPGSLLSRMRSEFFSSLTWLSAESRSLCPVKYATSAARYAAALSASPSVFTSSTVPSATPSSCRMCHPQAMTSASANGSADPSTSMPIWWNSR